MDDNYVSFQNAVGFDRSPERLLNSVVSISHHHSNRDPNISADKPPRFSVVIQHCPNDCRHPSVQRIGSPFSPEMESGRLQSLTPESVCWTLRCSNGFASPEILLLESLVELRPQRFNSLRKSVESLNLKERWLSGSATPEFVFSDGAPALQHSLRIWAL